MFHFRGFPPYLEAAAARLGLSRYRADRARQNQEIHRLSNLVAQACDLIHRAAKRDGSPDLLPAERAQIRDILDRAGEFRDQLAVSYHAAATIVDEAARGAGIEPHELPYRFVTDFDPVPVPNPDPSPPPPASATNGERRPRAARIHQT